MVDNEVAEILAEIKRRVSHAQEKSLVETSGVVVTSAPAHSPAAPPAAANGFAGFSVMARAWDRLPPVVSNRSGTLARIELWFKEKFRSAFRWLTWEQVNFNSATYQTLLEVVESLNSYEQHLAQLRNDVEAQSKQRSALSSQIEQLHREHLASIAQLNARVEGLSQSAKDQQAETQTRLAALSSESRTRDEQLID